MLEKTCSTCGENKPLDDFYMRKTGRGAGTPFASCKLCWKSINKNRKRDKTQHAMAEAGRKLGLTVEQVAAMHQQTALCGICGQPNNQSGRRLHIDHNHVTGQVRELLCHNCNTALGLVDESTDTLRSMIAYIERWAR